MVVVWVGLDGGSVDLGRCLMAMAWVWVDGFGVVYHGGLIWVCLVWVDLGCGVICNGV